MVSLSLFLSLFCIPVSLYSLIHPSLFTHSFTPSFSFNQPTGRAGLYLELQNLKEIVDEYRGSGPNPATDLRETIFDLAQRNGMLNDVPFLADPADTSSVVTDFPKDGQDAAFASWIAKLTDYLVILQDRLFSSGLHVLGSRPTEEELLSYLEAYYGDRMSIEDCQLVISRWLESSAKMEDRNMFDNFVGFIQNMFGPAQSDTEKSPHELLTDEATMIVSRLAQSTDEIDNLVNGLDGGYIPPSPGGDLLRDGPSVLPTGRNIHALDPYRMPSPGAWARGQRAAKEILRQHTESNDGRYPETIAVTLWGLDAIKTRGESVAIVLALVGAKPVKEGTGRIVRFELASLEELGRPRVDVLASLSGLFRDSFANVVDLLDDMFERAAQADEPPDMNFIKKHSDELRASGVDGRVAARLFSNPPGDYGSMVNEVVSTGDWSDSESLGETWKGRNVYSYGRNEGGVESAGTARPAVLDKLLATTERVVQEIDSVEYGISDIQEYYANTGALKKAAENRKEIDPKTGNKKKVTLSIIEAFGGSTDGEAIPVKDVEEVLRLEYRSKLLNPKWRDSMLNQGSGGAYEISQRMTAMIGWSATAEVDNFVFDQAAERYALDEAVAKQLQRSNPEAFKNVVRRLLEAAGRGMWSTDDETLEKLRDLYSDADDMVEQGSSQTRSASRA
jgi:magnesium chelatase subunit H